MAESARRQLDELDALAAVFCAEGELHAPWDELALRRAALGRGEPPPASPLHCSVRVRVAGVPRGSLCFTLPPDYPSRPAELRLSREAGWPRAADADAIGAELRAAAAAAAAEAGGGREALLECVVECEARLAAALEAEAREAEEREKAEKEKAEERKKAEEEEAEAGHGARILWFHHIKATEKRKLLVRWAREASLSGFSKPGFPGVVVVGGDERECGEYVRRVRALRWQAMEVRWEGEPPADALPRPFRELGESAMGEAAALCDAGGLGAPFREAVLKLGVR
ncbi:hypothetical protein AB1Y20_012524 [Prymnesium parvum]|uniref:Small nuclear ribonucleoprotein Prp3 C-terminal domain-containing protein n=1 Tax=Prymnesium parvum TaxID=97485 RepID=A0AB34II49_PRYPA